MKELSLSCVQTMIIGMVKRMATLSMLVCLSPNIVLTHLIESMSLNLRFQKYCCPVNFKTAEKSSPKLFRIGLLAFF